MAQQKQIEIMGLDMYLDKSTSVKNWNHTTKEEKYNITIEREDGHEIETKRITEIREEVMYWRKANHIHKFFIDNCADGDEERQKMYVERHILEDLVKELITVLHYKDDETSAEHLPTVGGFFFGYLEYDKHYYESCQETLEVISAVLKEEKGGYFEYTASW